MQMNRIKEAIFEKGMRQTDVAEMAGISRNSLHVFCKNDSQPRVETLFKIAKVLNVQPSELLASVDWDAITDADFEPKKAASAV